MLVSNNWLGYERRKARERRGIHLGGPGEPDYRRGNTEGEVKKWSRPMSAVHVRREVQKGRNEIVNEGGFTAGAVNYAERYRPCLRLIHGNRIVKRRRIG